MRRAMLEPLETRQLLAGGVDRLVNNNAGATPDGYFTQGSNALLAYDEHVVVAFDDSGGASSSPVQFMGVSTSDDGGESFIDRGVGAPVPRGSGGEPRLARDEVSGRLYLAWLNNNGGIEVARSTNDGASWSTPIAVSGTDFDDWPQPVVDNAPGAGQGTLYIVARSFGVSNAVRLFKSVDGGLTYSAPVTVVGSAGISQGAVVVVGPDHSVYVCWHATGNLQIRRSTDRGVTFGPARIVVAGLNTAVNGDLGLTGVRQGTTTPASFRALSFPRIAVNPLSGDLYVAYNQGDAAAGDRADVLLVQSSDFGVTWSTPLRINDDATTTDQWRPSIAVTPDGTHVGVFYYSREDDVADNNLFRYRGRIATVSGTTLDFAPSSPISDVASWPEFGRDVAVNTIYMGDIDGIAATNDAFHVTWTDSPDDLPDGPPRKDPNVYYDKIPIATNGIWTGLGDGVSWTDATNWSNNTVPGPDDDVVIDVAADPIIFLDNGEHVVRSLTLAENLSVIGGSLRVSGELSILSTGQLGLLEHGNQVLVIGGLALADGSTLEMNDNALIVDYDKSSPLSSIESLIRVARNGGDWLGLGITSTTARLEPLHHTTLGAIEASDYIAITGSNVFAGQTIDDTAVLVRYTYYGDTDFNGVVNFDDYSRTDAGFNQSSSGWINGDFDLNGVVNFDDYSLIDLAFNTQGPP